jgi:membrane fusion protein (multidrug efflux system)
MDPKNETAAVPPQTGETGGNVETKDGGNGQRNNRFFRIAVVVAPLLAVALAAYYFIALHPYESTDDAFIDGHAIQISPKVAGRVWQVLITDNQFVKKGESLVRIDPGDFDVAQAQAEASLAAAQSRLAQAKSQLIVSQAAAGQDQAAVGSAEAEAKRAQQDLARYQAVESRAVSREQVDAAVAAAQSTAAALEVAHKKAETSQAQIPLSQAQIGSAEADVQQAEALVRQAGLNTSYTDIVAPEDGWVTHRSVENGEYVQVGQALLAVVETDVWVTANFKETQLTYMKPGQRVSIEVDAYPRRTFRGHVDSIQAGTGAQFSLLPPENAAGNYVKVVQRVPVKIVFDPGQDPPGILPLGASVVPKVKVR